MVIACGRGSVSAMSRTYPDRWQRRSHTMRAPTVTPGVGDAARYARPMELSGSRGWQPRPTTTSGATASASTPTTPPGRRSSRARPLAGPSRLRSERRPLMYRHAFTADPPAEGRRRWITLDGIFYQADVWLDGAYLGDPEGYFFQPHFDITSLSRSTTTRPRRRGDLCSPQPHAGAATSPVSSRTGTASARTATRAASGDRSACTTPARADRSAPRAVPRRRRPTSASRIATRLDSDR
jgi:hypothetical protein